MKNTSENFIHDVDSGMLIQLLENIFSMYALKQIMLLKKSFQTKVDLIDLIHYRRIKKL